MSFLYMKAIDVIQPSIVCLRDNRKPPRLQYVFLRDFPFDDRVAHNADTVRVRDRDRSLEISALLNPRRSRHLAISVQCEPRREDRIGIRFSARMNDSDTGADGALSHYELAASGYESGVADLDAGNIGNRVQRARRSTNRKTKGILPWLCLSRESNRQEE
jgi:hypothetical protein